MYACVYIGLVLMCAVSDADTICTIAVVCTCLAQLQWEWLRE